MVSGQRDGRIAGSRFCGGGERPALSLSGSDLGAQAGTVRLVKAEVGGFVSCRLRGAALRLDEHVFRRRDGRNPKAKHGYSRDGRPDCLQVVIALVITPDGFPLAYEVMDGNTSDRTTLRGFLDRIEHTYGKAKRLWVMDRGIPTEAILAEMRDPARPVSYLVGTSKSKITQYEKQWLALH